MKKISICIPCYNEDKNIPLLYSNICKQFEDLKNYDYEIIFSDNNSTDNTQKILRELAKMNPKVKVIFNMNNYGLMHSQKNCTFRASGDAIIGMVCDLQDPPELIPKFVHEWEKGSLVVMGQKVCREERGVMAYFRTMYYKFTNMFSNVHYYEHVTGFGLFDKSVIDRIKGLNEPDVSIRHLIPELGYEVKLIPYVQPERKNGKSNFNFFKYIELAINFFIHTSTAPLRMVTLVGGIVSVLSFITGCVYFIYKIFNWNSFMTGIAPMVIGLFFWNQFN